MKVVVGNLQMKSWPIVRHYAASLGKEAVLWGWPILTSQEERARFIEFFSDSVVEGPSDDDLLVRFGTDPDPDIFAHNTHMDIWVPELDMPTVYTLFRVDSEVPEHVGDRFSLTDDLRADPKLVEAVEAFPDLVPEDRRSFYGLRVVDVPDDVDWFHTESDECGYPFLCERHRTWW